MEASYFVAGIALCVFAFFLYKRVKAKRTPGKGSGGSTEPKPPQQPSK